MKHRWQLTPLKLFLILAALGILIIIIAFLQIRELNNVLTDDENEQHENEQQFFTIERQWEEPSWTVANVFRPSTKATPVIVVDEHFEVLKYWFDAVTAKVIPGTGNTLLHIDGHPDNAIPRDLAKIPWFHLPHNHSEVANMMQSNDVFIAAAAATGLISRYIWVWPDWDRGEDHQTDHEISDVYAGWREYYLPNSKPLQRLCICVRNHSVGWSSDDDVENAWECWDDEPSLLTTGGIGHMEKGKQCQKVVSAVMEIIHEQKALTLLQEGGWIKPEESILLDIDEDFYGCESSFAPLMEAGLTKDNAEQVSVLLQGLLCVKDVKQELAADMILHTIIEIVADFKAQLCSSFFYIFPSTNKSCLSEFEADKALIDLISEIKDSLIKADAEDLLCSIDSTELVLQSMLRQLFSFTIPQLKSLQYVGACLVTAPTSLQFSPGSLHVCHGFNVPGDSVVKFHVPSEEENKERTALLKNILSHLPWQPFLVTVSRSMRDGYTPWRFFRYIETNVLSVLRAVFPSVTDRSFYFDENLLGGKEGWPLRHKRDKEKQDPMGL